MAKPAARKKTTKKKTAKKKTTKKRPRKKAAKKKKPTRKTAKKPRGRITLKSVREKISKGGLDALNPAECVALGIHSDSNVVRFPGVGLSEDEKIMAMFKSARLLRVQALFEEMETGKGIARLQAADRIAELEREISTEVAGQSVELDWDVFATTEAKEIG